MKLYKALKLRKGLVGEIAKLKEQIKSKNSYLEGSKNGEKFDVQALYDELLEKIDELTGIKFVINEANKEIQAQIYTLSEYKALIAFWNEVPVVEGAQIVGYGESAVMNYKVQFDEAKRNEIVKTFQKRVDAIQEEIDEYNFTTEIPWDVPEETPQA
jgi:molybdopterin converting factor small subunit